MSFFVFVGINKKSQMLTKKKEIWFIDGLKIPGSDKNVRAGRQVCGFPALRPALHVEDKKKNSSLTHGLKLYHQWQLYLCVSVFRQGALLFN